MFVGHPVYIYYMYLNIYRDSMKKQIYMAALARALTPLLMHENVVNNPQLTKKSPIKSIKHDIASNY